MSKETDDAERRRLERRQMQLARLGERTEGDLTRTEGDLTRTEGDLTRTEWDLTRTEGDLTRTGDDGGPPYVAAEIFRRAMGLGGHLVIAFIAPVSATSPRSRYGPDFRLARMDAGVAAARAALRRILEQVTNSGEASAPSARIRPSRPRVSSQQPPPSTPSSGATGG